MAKTIENLMKPTGRIRPSFELDQPLAMSLALYMRDNNILLASSVLRKAVKAFLPAQYVELAAKELAKRGRRKSR